MMEDQQNSTVSMHQCSNVTKTDCDFNLPLYVCIHTLNTHTHTHNDIILHTYMYYTHSTMVVAFAWKIIAIALAKKATVYALGRVRTVWSSMLMLPCVCQKNAVIFPICVSLFPLPFTPSSSFNLPQLFPTSSYLHISLFSSCFSLPPSTSLFPPPSPFLSPPILFALQTYGYPRLYRRLLEYNRRNITDRSRRRAIQDNVKYFFRIPNMIGRRFSMALWWVNVTCAAS